MTQKKYYTFMIDAELLAALKTARGKQLELSEAGIIREALREWLGRNGVKVGKAEKSERKRATTRKRS